MKLEKPHFEPPQDWQTRKEIAPVICYPADSLEAPDLSALKAMSAASVLVDQVTVPPRDGACIDVPAGMFFRVISVDGPQVGDLNMWNRDDPSERFYSGKTRALHGTHLSTGDRMWSSFPYMRPMATITSDSLDWYGFDEFGASVHDVIGTRCDPYTGRLLQGHDYHYCCHSNLTRAFAAHKGMGVQEAEPFVHDVLNVFMCTGFTRDTGQYFMKASPVRPGDHLEFFAEINLTVGLSACPGGDCSSSHSSDVAQCHPLLIEVWDPGEEARARHVQPQPSAYDRSHGT
ncbi:MAG: DUF1989 domain-containing protein [Pseudomonadota bacterium]